MLHKYNLTNASDHFQLETFDFLCFVRMNSKGSFFCQKMFFRFLYNCNFIISLIVFNPSLRPN